MLLHVTNDITSSRITNGIKCITFYFCDSIRLYVCSMWQLCIFLVVKLIIYSQQYLAECIVVLHSDYHFLRLHKQVII